MTSVSDTTRLAVLVTYNPYHAPIRCILDVELPTGFAPTLLCPIVFSRPGWERVDSGNPASKQ